MRVDFVITELFVGGAERCLTELAIGLAENDDRVRVFSLATLPTGEQSLLVDRLRDAGIPIESGGADRAIQFLSAYRQLKRWLKSSPPDVCQTFLCHANVLGTFAAKAAGVGVRVGGLRVAESRSIRCRIEQQAVNRMTSLVCVSKAVRQFAAEHLQCQPPKAIVIPNAVDVTRFATSQPMPWSDLDWPSDSDVSLFVGRLHPQKGIDLLQSSIDTLAPANSNRKLLLVGDGPLRSELETWAKSIGENRVRILPWQKDVAPLIKASRLLVLPSRYEGMPNVVLEAMASSKPVVCSRVEGSEELLSHAKEQQSFASEDAPTMRRLAEQILSDESLGEELGLQNLQRVKTDFSIPAMIDSYRSHYRSI